MRRDPDMASTYDTWLALSGVSASSSRSKRSGTEPQEAPRTPKKKKPQSLSAPSHSPGNPFRSPQKPAKSYTQAPTFPLRSLEATNTLSALRAVENEADESDVSDVDEALPNPQPHASQPSPTPTKVVTDFTLYTPRTKARKRLRGEDVKTPPHSKMARSSSNPRQALLLAQSPRASQPDDSRRSFSRIFSGSQQALEADVLGPSPQKSNRQRGFKPLFHSDEPSLMAEEPFPSSPTQASVGADPTAEVPALHKVQPDPTSIQVDDEDQVQISVLPYMRYGSARDASRFHHDDDNDDGVLVLPTTDVADTAPVPEKDVLEGRDHLTQIETLSLQSPIRHGSRASYVHRTKSDQVAQALLTRDEASTTGQSESVVHRQGRSGLDVDEVDTEEWEDEVEHDDDWASEVSSADYGLGDGDMDDDDVL